MRSVATRTVTALVLVVAASVLSAAALEGALRLVGYRPSLQSGWMLTSPYVAPDDDVIMIPRFLLGASFYERRTDAPLVLTIGDSFTEGFPVAAPDTYPAVLERALLARGLRADVANAGMGDSGPDQQLRLLQTKLLTRLHPAVVVWSLYANDLWDNVLKPVFTVEDGNLRPRSGRRDWLYGRQRLFDLAPLPAAVKRGSYAFNLVLKATEAFAKAAVPREYEHDPTAWGRGKLELELAEFERMAGEHGFTGYVLLIAPQSVYLAATDPSRWQDYWSAVEHRKIAPMVEGRRDVIVAWFGAAHATDIFAEDARDVGPVGDRHFNEAGYALLGELVADRVARDGTIQDGRSDTATRIR